MNSALLVAQNDIIDDIRAGLGGKEGDWNLKFVASGAEALSELRSADYEIIITELNVVDQDAVGLLEVVKESNPGVVRFVLTASDDRQKLSRVAEQAHQVIAKPIKPEALRMRIANSIALRVVLTDKKLHSRIARITSLPTLPSIYNQLIAEMQSETASMQKIANLIREDVAITAKIIHISNSAFFGLSARVENPLQAVNLLGMETVKSLVLAAGVFGQFTDSGFAGYSVDAIYDHSLAVGTSARHFANAFGLGRNQSEEALMAGMLHDIGKLVLLTNFREELTKAIEIAQRDNISMYEAERQVLGVSHCEIGAHLLSLWGMSDLILEAVSLHDTPAQSPCPMVNILASVHIANAFDHDQRIADRDPKFTHADVVYLGKAGLSSQLPYLRTMATAR